MRTRSLGLVILGLLMLAPAVMGQAEPVVNVHFSARERDLRFDEVGEYDRIWIWGQTPIWADGRLWHADGSLITDIDSLPIAPRDADVVYDARSEGPRAWIWDIAGDRDNRPVIVYTRLLDRSDHRYHYARWTGTAWADYELCPAGHWFQGTPKSKRRFEPYYSGGIALDHGDPSTVYLSSRVGSVFEIERWTTSDGGVSWSVEAITLGSARHNVRPCVVRHSRASESPRVLWMNVEDYDYFTDFRSTIRMDLPGTAIRHPGDLALR